VTSEELQVEYNYESAQLFNWSSAVIPIENFLFRDDNGKACILLIKPCVILINQTVYTGEPKALIFYFKNDLTPRSFDEQWGMKKTTLVQNHSSIFIRSIQGKRLPYSMGVYLANC
jgi:hypothetical protein